jgi:hypothetical protein
VLEVLVGERAAVNRLATGAVTVFKVSALLPGHATTKLRRNLAVIKAIQHDLAHEVLDDAVKYGAFEVQLLPRRFSDAFLTSTQRPKVLCRFRYLPFHNTTANGDVRTNGDGGKPEQPLTSPNNWNVIRPATHAGT